MWTYSVCLNLYLFSIWQWMITLLQWYLVALLEYGVCHFFLFWIVVHGFKKCHAERHVAEMCFRGRQGGNKVVFSLLFMKFGKTIWSWRSSKPKCMLLWIQMDKMVPGGDKFVIVSFRKLYNCLSFSSIFLQPKERRFQNGHLIIP